jgi:uncharacterized protein (DUF983 family)
MYKLPLCPYCGSRFLYGQVRDAANKPSLQCGYCKRTITVEYKKYRNRHFLISALVMVLINIGMLALLSMTDATVLPYLLVLTVIMVCVAYLLLPYTVRFVKPDRQFDRLKRVQIKREVKKKTEEEKLK